MHRLKAAIVPVTPFQQNCSIVFDEASKRGAVVDPGGEVERILAAIAELGVTVEKILLTHGHIDHAGGAAALQRGAGTAARAPTIPIEGPDERDRFLLEGLERQGARLRHRRRPQSSLPDRWLVEGDTVEVGGHVFDVLHCPGHTPGHIVLLQPEPTASRWSATCSSAARSAAPTSPTATAPALMRSIREKLFPLGDEVAFLCGHGPGSTIALERRTNPFAGEQAG